jgi:hypothetical protein
MTSRYATALAGALLLLGGHAVATASPATPQKSAAPILVADADGGDFDAQRHDYMQKAQGEFQSWQDRMTAWLDETKEKGAQASAQAQQRLDHAWTDLKADWRKLQAAAPATWDQARESFDEASQRLKTAWQKINSEG